MPIRAKITEEGLLIPREVAERALGENSGEVEIFEEPGRLTVSPAASSAASPDRDKGDEVDPIFSMGEDPVDDEITDGSTTRDRYLYTGH